MSITTPFVRALLLAAIFATGAMGIAGCGGSGEAGSGGDTVTGLWRYTNLITSDGQELPLTGIFLFKDGFFMQQSIFDGDPFEEQGAMAHAGPYTGGHDAVQLVAQQTISVAPDSDDAALSFRRDTEHDVSVSPSGAELTLVFSSGTVQELTRLGPGDGDVYRLDDGAFALVDDYFILVQGNENGTVSGFGTYRRSGDSLTLEVERWAEADRSAGMNLRDTTLQAIFDGNELTLPNGRSFRVLR